jgi:hypothetical protein
MSPLFWPIVEWSQMMLVVMILMISISTDTHRDEWERERERERERVFLWERKRIIIWSMLVVMGVLLFVWEDWGKRGEH